MSNTHATTYFSCDIHRHISKKDENFIALMDLFPQRNVERACEERNELKISGQCEFTVLVTLQEDSVLWQHVKCSFLRVCVLGEKKTGDFGFMS